MDLLHPHFTKGVKGTRLGLGLCIATLLAVALVGFAMLWADMPCKPGVFRSPLKVASTKVHGASSRLKVASTKVDGATDFGILGVPWCRSRNGETVNWTRDDLIKGLREFVKVYHNRPIKNNVFGMAFDHSFGLWFIARWLRPDLMIESGVFKGHSTWVLRQAVPDKPIISISPIHPGEYLKKGPAYVDKNCKYYSNDDFIDFGNIRWHSVMEEYGVKDQSKVLVFFDDHQNEFKRFQQALEGGFHHLLFDDNYDTGTGDHYSLRQICDQIHIKGGGHSCYKDSDEARLRATSRGPWKKVVDVNQLCGPRGEWWGIRGAMRDNFSHSHVQITQEKHFENWKTVESSLDVYWELPPVAGPRLTHQTRYDPARTSNPTVGEANEDLFVSLGLHDLDMSVFNGYTQMVYIKISQ